MTTNEVPTEASAAAIALIGSAVIATSAPAPDDPSARHQWFAKVGELAAGLYRQAQVLDDQLRILAQCKPVTGVIRSVEERSKRGLITIRPTMGRAANDPNATESMRTPWLRDRAGLGLFEQAKALVGVECRFGIWYEAKSDGSGQDVRMVAWIEPLVSRAPAPEPPQAATGAAADVGPTTNQGPIAREARPPVHGLTDRPTTVKGTPPAAAPKAPELDVSQLRNLPMSSWDDLMFAGERHFGLDGDTIYAIGMAECGAAGPRSATQYRKTWNALVTKYFQPAA